MTEITSQNTSVTLDHISVSYRVPNEHYSTFKEYVIRLVQGRVKYTQFLALNEISLDVIRGEIFGIIGRNGAGKSTLLKLVARVMQPTKGRVVTIGKVAPLLEVGAGFHPDLTGRENVYLNAAMLGYHRKDVDVRVNRIIDFAELQDFIDAPLRTYSTGMEARLGFAVATDVKPDILIVDEILGVGDEAFQKKCLNRILGYSLQGTTILLVSHSSEMIQAVCHRVAWLDHGKLMGIGPADEMIGRYHEGQAR
jgi:ABC-type polysaccharide/polyol phosphate transport system ATPase subunit